LQLCFKLLEKSNSTNKLQTNSIKFPVLQFLRDPLRQPPDQFLLHPSLEKIDDEFLPVEVLETEGGARRRRSSVHSVTANQDISLAARDISHAMEVSTRVNDLNPLV